MKLKACLSKADGKITRIAAKMSLKKMQFLFAFFYAFILRYEVFATNTLLDAADNNASTIFDRFITTFDTTIFPFIMLFLIIGLAIFGKNDQMSKLIIKGIIYCVIAFVLLNCFNLFVNTIMWIVNLLNGKSSSNIIPEASVG